ncbi:hypothetical protein [Burkholderia sp. SIMBA_062]|uniref:hypothetical protein n=1 Tax=Burkholderia sp. SIMBA_062 TaxID=3085803 RepID=UPI003979C785
MTARKPFRSGVDTTPRAADDALRNARIGRDVLLYPVRHAHYIRLVIGFLIVVAGMLVIVLHGSTLN